MLPVKPAILDSEDRSVSVAEARHMARVTMLLPALDAIFALGMNPQAKDGDRKDCLKFIVEFASEAQGGGSKQVGKLSPEAARLIAKLGLQKELNEKAGSEDAATRSEVAEAPSSVPGGDVRTDEEEG